MANPEACQRYFSARADLADDLFRNGWREEGYLVGTSAIDAVAQIWKHDAERSR